MKKFQYLQLEVKVSDLGWFKNNQQQIDLTSLGQVGWELVSVTPVETSFRRSLLYSFKRETR